MNYFRIIFLFIQERSGLYSIITLALIMILAVFLSVQVKTCNANLELFFNSGSIGMMGIQGISASTFPGKPEG